MNSSNTTEHYTTENDTDYSHHCNIYNILWNNEYVIDISILVIGFPIICLAIYSLYQLIRADMVVPIYIINLLNSDLLQIIARPARIVMKMACNHYTYKMAFKMYNMIFNVGQSASMWFMVCIALDRYLVVAHPLWYRYHRSIRHATLVSAAVWVLALVFPAIYFIYYYTEEYSVYNLIYDILLSILFLLPFPLLVFFFVGTWRAIADATSVRHAEKRRILRVLALVLGTYTVLFLPFCIVYLMYWYSEYKPYIAYKITSKIVYLSALVDPVLYIFIRPDVRNTLGSLPCCQRLFTLTNCWTPRDEQEETEYTATVSSTVTSV
ncbi:uracil nucleotide/cysteinyl leukotriene receptor-like [Amia ocellicauda]|uniref:uracil nucleotide/cysteinyl leukotriene receptor-like n=1 Tax=Amia ocellicauda TaxID=2972642 RepID=UPI0034649588